MIRYNSMVEKHLVYQIEGDWIQLTYLEQMEKFRISKRLAEGSLFLELKSEIRDETECLIEAVRYMQESHKGISKLDQLSKIAGLLHISYGDLQVKIGNGELVDIDGEVHFPEWIPAMKRLPENGDMVLCTTVTQAGDHTIHIGYYGDYSRRWHAGKVRSVIAWMPLPEVYKGEKD